MLPLGDFDAETAYNTRNERDGNAAAAISGGASS